MGEEDNPLTLDMARRLSRVEERMGGLERRLERLERRLEGIDTRTWGILGSTIRVIFLQILPRIL
jgi:hypothetical protein